tara:strand:- start:90 stop:437 length:348 start_codon:yes stop_codon:yes gene_type:complete
VIGGFTYTDAPLVNPKNGARLMASALWVQDFEVMERLDVEQGAMKLTVIEFGYGIEVIQDDAVTPFYCADHGVQVNGQNYLNPVNTRIKNEGHVGVFAVTAIASVSASAEVMLGS